MPGDGVDGAQRRDQADVSVQFDTITVSWTPGSGGNATQIKVVLFNEDVTDLVDIQPFNPTVNDPGIYTFKDVEPGTYSVGVSAFNSEEGHMTRLAPVTYTVQ